MVNTYTCYLYLSSSSSWVFSISLCWLSLSNFEDSVNNAGVGEDGGTVLEAEVNLPLRLRIPFLLLPSSALPCPSPLWAALPLVGAQTSTDPVCLSEGTLWGVLSYSFFRMPFLGILAAWPWAGEDAGPREAGLRGERGLSSRDFLWRVEHGGRLVGRFGGKVSLRCGSESGCLDVVLPLIQRDGSCFPSELCTRQAGGQSQMDASKPQFTHQWLATSSTVALSSTLTVSIQPIRPQASVKNKPGLNTYNNITSW